MNARSLLFILLIAAPACSGGNGRLSDDDDSGLADDDDSAGQDDDDTGDDDDAADSLGDGLQAHWRFDEEDGDIAADSTANGQNCTVTDASWTYGAVEGALDFDGDGDSADCGDILNDLVLPLSVALWLNIDVSTDTDHRIFHSEENSLNHNGIWMNLTSTRTLHFSYGDGGSSSPSSRRTATTAQVVPVGEWVHVGIVASGPNDMLFFFDGEAIGTTYSGSGTDMETAADSFLIGSSVYDGRLDDFRVYDRALSADEVSLLASMGTR